MFNKCNHRSSQHTLAFSIYGKPFGLPTSNGLSRSQFRSRRYSADHISDRWTNTFVINYWENHQVEDSSRHITIHSSCLWIYYIFQMFCFSLCAGIGKAVLWIFEQNNYYYAIEMTIFFCVLFSVLFYSIFSNLNL